MPSLDVSIAKAATSSFPQTGEGRTREALTKAIARYGGGAGDPARLEMAVEALHEAVREYNGVLWVFNRLVQDITLTAATSTYTLQSTFRAFERAKTLDASDIEKENVEWVGWTQFVTCYQDQGSTGDPPSVYSAQNTHETGTVYFYPKPVAPTTGTRPKARLYYFRRMALPAAESTLDVPPEIEQGIQTLAVAIHMSQFKSFDVQSVGMMYRRAETSRLRLEQEFRVWPDYVGGSY